jgi:hypothetical protein
MRYEDFLDTGWEHNTTDQKIVERWREAGRIGTPNLRDLNHIRWRLMFESDRFPTIEHATQDWFPPGSPPPVEPGPALPVLRTTTGSRFLVDVSGAEVDYREATAMGLYRLWLDGHRGKIADLLGYFRENDINAIRVLFNLDSDFWLTHGRANSHLQRGFYDELTPFVNFVASHGIYTRLCLFGGVEPFGAIPDWTGRSDVVSSDPAIQGSMEEYAKRFVEATRDCTSILYEVANEPAQIGFGSDSEVVRSLGMLIKELAPDRLMNFGCATDEDNLFYALHPADFLDEHLARHDDWDYQASIKRLIHHAGADQTVMPFMSGEWMNLGTHGTESTATAFASAAMLRLKYIIPAFHARCLLWGDVPDSITSECLRAWSRGLDMIPYKSLVGAECNGHWVCSPFDSHIFPPTEEASDEWNGPIRCFGRSSGPRDSDYIGLSIREPKGYEMVTTRECETLHIEQWGSWQCRILRTT